jgi:transposase
LGYPRQPEFSQEDIPMEIAYTHCAGLDVHKKTVVACVMTPSPDEGRDMETRTFGTMTVDVLALSD